MAELRDYVAWHSAYDDPESTLSWRLGVVRGLVNQFLDKRPGPVRIVSACAGDGRDVLGVLSSRPDADRVTATLLEVNETLAARARTAARSTSAHVEVRRADAGDTDSYVGAVPADLVLLVGVFGNLSAADLERTISAAPQLCAKGAQVVWTHGRRPQDRNDLVRRWFDAAGFVEESYAELDRGHQPSVGLWRLERPPVPLQPGTRLFEFIR